MTETFAILDLEWTAWEGSFERGWSGPGEEIEIVQVGMAIFTDDAGIEEIDSLEVLVRPRINPDLSDYFTALTGITQEDVDQQGVDFGHALGQIEDFIDETVHTVYSFGGDGEVVLRNCRLCGLVSPFQPDLFASVYPQVVAFVDDPEPTFTSSDLPDVMGFTPPGQAHTALADVRCIAQALRIMRNAGAF